MTRHDIILEELGLAPLWIRRELLQALAEQEAEQAEAAAFVGHDEAHPPHPADTLEAPPAEARMAPAEEMPRSAPVIPINRPSSKSGSHTAPASPANTEIDPEEQSRQQRAARIAGLSWDELQAEISQCRACGLCEGRTQTVFGVGQPGATWMVVGEAPGAEEDKRGEPFVGQAGKLLDQMLFSVSAKRNQEVYIGNVLKCRPPGNRNPQPGEVALCAPFLLRQIALIQPKLIIASGRFAVQTLLSSTAPISALRGKVHQYGDTPVVVTYHPAYLLRNLPDKAKAWQDLLLAKRTVNPAHALPPQQATDEDSSD